MIANNEKKYSDEASSYRRRLFIRVLGDQHRVVIFQQSRIRRNHLDSGLTVVGYTQANDNANDRLQLSSTAKCDELNARDVTLCRRHFMTSPAADTVT